MAIPKSEDDAEKNKAKGSLRENGEIWNREWRDMGLGSEQPLPLSPTLSLFDSHFHNFSTPSISYFSFHSFILTISTFVISV